jgi:hypothetical protein
MESITDLIESPHNSSEPGWDDLTEGQRLCLEWAINKDWDRIKGYAKEHGPEILFGAVLLGAVQGVSVLSLASIHQNVEMVKLILEAGFDNKEVMFTAADVSLKNSDNSTILRLLLEHGLDKRIII